MDVRYNRNQRDVSNPVFDEKHHLEGQVEIDDHYSMPDESLKNPLMVSGPAKPDKIRIVSLVIECVILCAVVLIAILSIVILVKPFVIEQTCTAPLTSAGLSSDDKDFITTNCNITISPEMIGYKVADMLNRGSNDIRQNLSQLLQATSDLSQSIAYIKGFGDDQAVLNQNQSDKLDYIIESVQNASDALTVAVGSLSTLQTTTTSTAGVANDILLITEDILDLTNRSYLLNYVNTVSCSDILRLHPNSSSGYYHINSRTVYCEMEPLCNSTGWTRIAYFDAKTESCPSGFRTYASGTTRACGRNSRYSGGCSSSLTFDTGGVSYTQVCGRATGIQYGSPDTINNNNIDSHYIDGLALTRGSPRQHVWSFIAGIRDTYPAGSNCPCNSPPGSRTPPSFVGSDYFCESGNHGTGWIRYGFYASDPLWDGQGCGSQETACCAAPGLPWFHKDFGNTSSTDFLELRVCGNSGWNDEDVPFANYEFYIK